MKTCIVIDNSTSAIGLAAWARYNPSSEVIVSASDYATCSRLLTAIDSCDASTLFFAWRGALTSILQSRRSSKALEKIISGRVIGILIPDLLGLEPRNIEGEKLLLNYADYYLVTSRELFYEYKTVFPESPPRGLYRDFPDVALIQELRSMQKSEKPIDVIWVGNSRWGIHHGIEDHKGLHEIVIPLENRFEGSLKFEYIDSAKLRIPHRNVLELIQASRILIQTSKSEGTGLPLLEAAGLGTIVLTTKVGISEDFLNGNLREFIVLRDVESFHSAITHVIDNTAELGKQLMSRFDEYVEEIRYDLLPKDVIPKLKASRSFNRYFTILSFSKWFRRWIIARANTRRFDF